MPPPGPVRLSIRVVPRASRDRIGRGDGGQIRVWVTAPPAEGKANKAVIKLLSKRLGVPKSRLSIVSGASSRNKVLEVDGLEMGDVDRLIPVEPCDP